MSLASMIVPRTGQMWWHTKERRRVLIVSVELEAGWITTRPCNEWGVLIRGKRGRRERRTEFGDVRGYLYTGLDVISA